MIFFVNFFIIQVRRGKINEKLRCLQNIVPGCYKVNNLCCFKNFQFLSNFILVKILFYFLVKKNKSFFLLLLINFADHGNGSNVG